MQALRRLRSMPLNLLRTNTTLTTQSSADSIPPPPIPEAVKPKPSQDSGEENAEPVVQPIRSRNKRGRVITRRPQISLASPRDWKRPIAYGVLPAYDEALRYLMKDSAALNKEAEEYRAAIAKEEGTPDRDELTLEQKREKLNVLEVQSEINLPEVRWKVANGMGEQ